MRTISLMFLCFMISAAGFGKKNSDLGKIAVVSPPQVIIAEDSVTVILRVRVPQEICNKEMLHRLNIYVVHNEEYQRQFHVGEIDMMGNKRARSVERRNRREGIVEKSQWKRDLKSKDFEDQIIEWPVKAPIPDWMDENVSVYVVQSHSSRMKMSMYTFPYERYTPLFPKPEDSWTKGMKLNCTK